MLSPPRTVCRELALTLTPQLCFVSSEVTGCIPGKVTKIFFFSVGVRFPARGKIFLNFTATRPPPRPTQPPHLCEPRALSPRVKGQGSDSPLTITQVKNGKALPPYVFLPWCLLKHMNFSFLSLEVEGTNFTRQDHTVTSSLILGQGQSGQLMGIFPLTVQAVRHRCVRTKHSVPIPESSCDIHGGELAWSGLFFEFLLLTTIPPLFHIHLSQSPGVLTQARQHIITHSHSALGAQPLTRHLAVTGTEG